MITDSSRNYLDQNILLIWEDQITPEEVENYMSENYGDVKNYDFRIEETSEGPFGYQNPGKVYITY